MAPVCWGDVPRALIFSQPQSVVQDGADTSQFKTPSRPLHGFIVASPHSSMSCAHPRAGASPTGVRPAPPALSPVDGCRTVRGRLPPAVFGACDHGPPPPFCCRAASALVVSCLVAYQSCAPRILPGPMLHLQIDSTEVGRPMEGGRHHAPPVHCGAGRCRLVYNPLFRGASAGWVGATISLAQPAPLVGAGSPPSGTPLAHNQPPQQTRPAGAAPHICPARPSQPGGDDPARVGGAGRVLGDGSGWPQQRLARPATRCRGRGAAHQLAAGAATPPPTRGCQTGDTGRVVPAPPPVPRPRTTCQ